MLPLAALSLLAACWTMAADIALAHDVKRQSAAMAAPPKPAAAATYAVWWVIMNNPGFCGGICGLDDLAAADLGATLFHAAGLAPETAQQGTPVQPPARYASGDVPTERDVDTCVPGECTPLQTVTFFPPD